MLILIINVDMYIMVTYIKNNNFNFVKKLMKFYTVLLSVFAMTQAAEGDPEPKCCVVCADDTIKTFSVDTKHGHCGESCIPPKKFNMYKIFEPGLTRASSNDAKACEMEGWPTYWKTETHGIPHILTV